MADPYYDPLVDGYGLEGVVNFANTYSEGWMVNLFLLMIWIVSTYVLSKSEYKMANVLTFTFLLTFLLAIIFSLFITINPYIIFFTSIGFVGALVWSIIGGK